MTKEKHFWYIEFCVQEMESDPDYAMQSRFFESKEEAINWLFINFDFINEYMVCIVMRTTNEIYGDNGSLEDYDIMQVEVLR